MLACLFTIRVYNLQKTYSVTKLYVSDNAIEIKALEVCQKDGNVLHDG